MTPHRPHGRGTWQLDRVVPGIGRIRRASGTLDRSEYDQLNAMITRLRKRGRMDLLAALRDQVLSPLELLHQIEDHGLDNIQLVEAGASATSLRVEWKKWLEQVERAATRRMYDLAWRRLSGEISEGATRYLAENAALEAIAPALQKCRKDMVGSPPAFNRCRASWQAFLKWHVGTLHPAYVALDGVPKLKERPSHRRGLTLLQAMRIRDSLPAPHSTHWWDLVTSGMRVGEYFQSDADGIASWTATDRCVSVTDSKRGGETRVLPRIGEMLVPDVTVWAFRDALRELDRKLTPHVARYTYKSWALDAGIPNHRVEQYMGHALKGVDGLYAKIELGDWVESDRERMLAYLAVQTQRLLEERKGGLRSA